MSADLLRSRLEQDLTREANERAEILVDQRQAPLDEMRFNQGFIAGLRHAAQLLDERSKNLHANG